MAAEARELVQERAQVTRRKLVSAAIALFAERGYDATPTREIETAAGVNRGLITYHFGSKEALWKLAMEELFEGHADQLSIARVDPSDTDPVERLRTVIRTFVRYCADRPEVNRIMVQEGKHADWRLEFIVERYVKPYYALTKSLYEAAVAEGAALPMDHLHFHYILTGGAALIFAMAPECAQLSGRDPRDPRIVDAHADILVELLIGGKKTNEARNVHARRKNTNRTGGGKRGTRSGGGRAVVADGDESVSVGRGRRVGARKKR